MFLYMRVVTNQTAPVIVFCRSGRRAGKAKEVLEQMGYTKVLNAGGLNDLRYL
jgi:phage shock protein E